MHCFAPHARAHHSRLPTFLPNKRPVGLHANWPPGARGPHSWGQMPVCSIDVFWAKVAQNWAFWLFCPVPQAGVLVCPTLPTMCRPTLVAQHFCPFNFCFRHFLAVCGQTQCFFFTLYLHFFREGDFLGDNVIGSATIINSQES